MALEMNEDPSDLREEGYLQGRNYIEQAINSFIDNKFNKIINEAVKKAYEKVNTVIRRVKLKKLLILEILNIWFSCFIVVIVAQLVRAANMVVAAGGRRVQIPSFTPPFLILAINIPS